MTDRYRADCRPPEGCRNCGVAPSGRRTRYCSNECRWTFESNHFWNAARFAAIDRHSIFAIDARSYIVDGIRFYRRTATICFRCGERCVPEVNHIVPLNGDRPSFGCMHHRENLNVLCHACHLQVTAEQRAAGLIG